MLANVADRVAQTAAAMLGEEKLEPILCPDSYGYRPGRSAHDALAVARKRCWNKDWVLDLDVGAFFDSVGHDLLMRAVAHHTDERWVLLYIERWLKAPMTMAIGEQIRDWHLNRRSATDLAGLARAINARIRGWFNYYGAFYRSELYAIAARIDEHLVRWAMQKFKRLRGQPTKAWRWLDAARQREPQLFAHWHLLASTPRRTVGAL